ncbi:helix-turn-helix domain-containing protein [Tautonia plasticadhaerens]|uniref:Helix-turn-helix domain protein n=1 Tax=Tautonia plasticadhaerens TaxID=2527974 RepID=A0A518H7S9_9BACT|nr:helix-turn-helix domain-containing protein [Tautonia plasticadhaerens]QDV36917.1 Helix-turn-helix domain protein [Tautonia plasticadhaerens]
MTTALKDRLGYYTLADLARRLEIPYRTLYGHVRTGRFPTPTRTTGPDGRRLYYNQEDMDLLVSLYGPKEGNSDAR